MTLTSGRRKAVMGAVFSLYLNFINLFMMMLRLMGRRAEVRVILARRPARHRAMSASRA